jgi:hypothetical protein
MRKTVFAVAALATALSLGATVGRAAAMPSAAPTQLGLATADGGHVQKAALVAADGAAGESGGERGYGSDLVAGSTALPARVGVWPGAVRDGAGVVRDGAGKLIVMMAGA